MNTKGKPQKAKPPNQDLQNEILTTISESRYVRKETITLARYIENKILCTTHSIDFVKQKQNLENDKTSPKCLKRDIQTHISQTHSLTPILSNTSSLTRNLKNETN